MYFCRSVLFAPGIDARKMEKAQATGADVVILDLEDAVDISRKAEARELVSGVLREPRRGPLLWVRVNPPDTDFFMGDVLAVMAGRPDGIMLPKAESAGEVARVAWLLRHLEKHYGIEPGAVDLVPLVESAAGVKNAAEIAAVPGVKRLCFGAVDYTLDMGVELTKDGRELFFARSALAVASRSAGIEGPVDTVFVDIKDGAGLVAECRLARSLGFQGKLVIHPNQVDAVNNIFSPTREEIDRAGQIIEVFDAALARGSGVAQLNGKLIDKPVVERARKVLEMARALGLVD